MDTLVRIPEWLGAAVIGAVIAALGYVGKLIIEFCQSIFEAQNTRRARLVELQSLLRSAWVSFAVQNDHAKRLLSMVQEQHVDVVAGEKGYERIFSKAYKVFTPDEKALHAIIRSITIHSLRQTNLSLSNWLKTDMYFKAQKSSQAILGDLAEKLAVLEAHLILWHAKYEAWIPDTPEHALVYLADEEAHGIRFPSGIDEVVSKALT
jgi:hypothetical protein